MSGLFSSAYTPFTFETRKNPLGLQQHFFNLDVSLTRLGAHICWGIGAYHVFIKVRNPVYNEHLILFLPERDGKVHDLLHKV